MAIKNPSYKAMAISCLCNALLTDPDAGVRCSAAKALGRIGSEEAIPTLLEASCDENANVRQKVTEALGKIGDDNQMSGDRIIIQVVVVTTSLLTQVVVITSRVTTST